MPSFFNFPVSCAPSQKNVIFIGCNFESRASEIGLHKQKKDTASAKEGKVSLLRTGVQSQGCALTFNTAHSPPRRLRFGLGRLKILSRSPTQATCWCWLLDLKSRSYNLLLATSSLARPLCGLKRTFRSLRNS